MPALASEYARFDSISGVATSGGKVTGWTDRVGGYTAAQAVDGDRPLLTGGLIEFSNSEWLDIDGATFGTLSQPNTIFGLFNLRNSAVNQAMVDGFSTNRHAMTNNPTVSNCYAGINLTHATAPFTGWQRWMVVYDGASSKFWINGVETTGDAGSVVLGGLTIGSLNDQSRYLDGFIRHLIVCDGNEYSKFAEMDAWLISQIPS
jgi:hypothetical protein